jgi:O-antigen ligase
VHADIAATTDSDARSELWRPRAHAIAAVALGGAGVALPASQQGGYFPTAWGWIAVGLFLAAALALAFRSRIDVHPLQWAFLAGVWILLAWTALSATWSASLPRSIAEAERTVIYAAAVLAVVAVVSAMTLAPFLGGLVAAVVGISVAALVERQRDLPEGGGLAGLLGYSNALGLLTVIGMLLALGFVARGGSKSLRAAAAAALPLLGATLFLTRSRGALVAGAMALLFVIATYSLARWRVSRRLALSVCALVLVAAAVTFSVVSPSTLLGKTYGAFRSPPAAEGRSNDTFLSFSGNNRTEYWRIAWREYRESPWLGSGAGTFELYWERDRQTIYGARDAHNLYLETLAELGPFGLTLLMVTLGIPFVGLRDRTGDPLVAAALAAYLAFLVHAAVDWDWEMPAVTLAGLFSGSAVLVSVRGNRRPLSMRARWLGLAVILVIASSTAVAYRGNLAVEASTRALARPDYSAAEESARTVNRWTPWAADGWRLLGEAQLGAGDRTAAHDSFMRAISKDPKDWELWYDLALVSSAAERRNALEEASRLNPYSLPVRALLGS